MSKQDEKARKAKAAKAAKTKGAAVAKEQPKAKPAAKKPAPAKAKAAPAKAAPAAKGKPGKGAKPAEWVKGIKDKNKAKADKGKAKAALDGDDEVIVKPKKIKPGSALVVVESPAKARTINKYLGANYIVKASVGHVRDLPKSKIGVDLEDGTFEPVYEVLEGKKKVLGDGAALVEHGDDVLAALAGNPRQRPPAVLDPTARRIASAIADGARGVDAIVDHTGLSVREVLRTLPMMDASAANARMS